MAQKKSFARMVGEYSSLAFVVPASLLVGYGIGYGLDKWLGTDYWHIVWLLLGVVAGMRELIRRVLGDFQKDMDAGSGED
jgi:F0F1-type ATP synthase assembly protein I